MRFLCRGMAYQFVPQDFGRDILFLQSIESVLRNQQGIHSIKVALLAERGVIEYDPEHWNVDKLVNVRALSFASSVILPGSCCISRKYLT